MNRTCWGLVWLSGLVFLLTLGSGGCNSGVNPSNPYDPDTSAEKQADAQITGIIMGLDSITALPVPLTGVEISYVSTAEVLGQSMTTDDSGAFEFADVRPSRLSIEIFHAQHIRQFREITLGAGEERVLAITMDRLPDVATDTVGQVSGIAQKSGELSLEEALQDHSGIVVEVEDAGVRTVTNALGEFDLFLNAGTYNLVFSAPHYNLARRNDVEVLAAEAIVVPDSPVVLDPNPGFVAGMVVLEGMDVDQHGGILLSLLGGATGTTAANGSFRLTNVAAGTYTMTAAKDGFDTHTSTGIVVYGGRETQVPDIDLPISRGSVAGRVMLAGQAEHGGTIVELTGTVHTAQTNTQGAYEINDIPVGTYELAARHEGFARGVVGSVLVAAGESTAVEELNLALRKGDFDINGGAPYTNDPQVTLTLTSDDAVQMQISELSDFSDASYVAFEVSPSFLLSNGDQAKTVYVQYLDSNATPSQVFSSSITLDTQPPDSANVSINAGALYSNNADGLVNITFSASDATSGVEKTKISNDGVFDSEVWQDYVNAKTHTLDTPLDDGLKTVYVLYKDFAGNETAQAVEASITLDRILPTLNGFVIDCNGQSDAAQCNSSVVELAIDASGASRMALSNDAGFAAEIFEPIASQRAWYLTPGDGDKLVWIKLLDEAGNKTDAAFDGIYLDQTVPQSPTLILAGGAAYVAGPLDVQASLTTADADIDQMRFAVDGTLDSEAWQNYVAAFGVDLPESNGENRVFAQLQDQAGNLSPVVEARIVVDTTAPQLFHFEVGNGSGWVNSADGSTQVSINCADNLVLDAEMNLLVEDEGAQVLYQGTYADVVPIVLGAGEVAKTVTASCSDPVGNLTASAPVAVSVDHSPPSINSFTLNGGAANEPLSSQSITIHLLDISDNFSGVLATALSDASFDCATANYAYPGAGDIGYTFSSGEGARTIYLCAMDTAGNRTSSPVAANNTVMLDTVPPEMPSLVLAGGAAYVNTHLTLSVSLLSADAAFMRFAVDGTLDDEAWVPYNAASTLDLPVGDGAKTVLAQVLDAGNNVSPIAQAQITVDGTAPQISSISVGDDSGWVTTADGSTQLHLSCSDALVPDSELSLVVVDNLANTLFSGDYLDVVPIVLGAGEVAKTVTASCSDPMGNSISSAAIAVSVDHSAPTINSFSLNGGGADEPTNNPAITLHLLDITDNFSGVMATALAETSFDCETANYAYPTSGDVGYSLSAGEGSRRLYLCAIDLAGNVSAAAVASDNTVFLDTVVPDMPVLELAGGAAYVDTHLTLSVSLLSADAAFMRFATDGTLDDETWVPYNAAGTLDLPVGDGAKTVLAQVLDAGSNVSPIAQAQITVDGTAPQMSSISVGDDSGWVTTADGSTQLHINCSDALVPDSELSLVVVDNLASTLFSGDYLDVVPIVLGAGEEAKTVTATCSDPMGNSISSAAIAVSVDHSAPSINSFSLNGGGADDPTNNPAITVHLLNITDNFSGVMATALAETSFDCATANYAHPTSGDVGYSLSAGEGSRRLYLCAIDLAGNVSAAAVASDNTVFLDTVVPDMPVLELAGGAAYVDTHLTLSISLLSADASFMRFAIDGTLDDEAWVPYNAAGTLDLSAGDGAKTVLAQVLDAGSNVSPIAQAQIIVDGTAPQMSSISVGDDSGWVTTADGSTQLHISCSDALALNAEINLTIIDGDMATLYSGDYLDVVPIVLGATEEAKTVTATCSDPIGNSVSSAAIAVSVDHTAPSINSFTLNGGAANEATASPSVTLHLLDVDDNFSGVSGTALAETSFDCTTATYSYPSSGDVGFTLSASDGQRYVYLCARDVAGNVTASAVASDNAVDLDTQTPLAPTVVLAGGTDITRLTSIGLSITPPEVGLTLELSGDIDEVGSYSADAPPATVTLAGDDGQLTVSAIVIDAAGNRSSSASDWITLDTEAPYLYAVAIDDNEPFATTADGEVTLTLAASDALSGVNRMQISTDGVCDTEPVVDFEQEVTFYLDDPANQGLKHVYVCFLDIAGNVSDPAHDQVSLDYTPPVINNFSLNGETPDEPTNSREILARVAVIDGIAGQAAVALSDASFSCSDAQYTYHPFQNHPFLLSEGEGQRFLYLCAQDGAGNYTASAVESTNAVWLDTTAPETPSMQVADFDGDGFALSEEQVELRWNFTAETSGYLIRRFVVDVDSSTQQIADLDASVHGLIDDVTATVGNTHLYQIRAYDAVGNVSNWSSVVEANPFDPIDGVFWIRSIDLLKFTFTPNTGTFWQQATYWWSNVLYSSYYQVLGSNILQWERPEPPERQVNERLMFRTANQDNSLVYDTSVSLRINQTRTLDSDGDPGKFTSLAVGSDRVVHISHFDDDTDDLKYTTNKPGYWVTYTVDSLNDTGTSTSLALDSNNNVHISYHYNTDNDLRYATNASGAWVVTTDIDTAANVGDFSSIAVDSQDYIHIGYYDVTNTNLKYATNAPAGTWSTTTAVNTGDSQGRFCSLVLDSNDNAYIAHLNTTTKNMELATNESGAWASPTIYGPITATVNISMAIDLADKLHISFSPSPGSLYYGTNASGGWAFEEADGPMSGYGGTSIAVDAQSKVHISHREADHTELRYTTNLSGIWESITVDNAGDLGLFSSLAVDNLGIVHISYNNTVDKQLRYANVFTYPWRTETPDTSGNKNFSPAVAVDSKGHTHISYMDTIDGYLTYATNQDGSWQISDIDKSAVVGFSSSIAIDGKDFIHISYYDQTDSALKYINNTEGVWTATTLDSEGIVGQLTSLAIDSNGKIHIAYRDNTNQRVKYINNVKGSWVETAIYATDNTTLVGISLDIDSKDNIHIVHYHNHNLYYSTNAGGSWATIAVDTPVLPAYTGIDPALAIDSNDFIHISYRDGNNMTYLTNASGSLKKTEIEVAGVSGNDSDIAIDENDNVHIIYSNTDLQDLHYATNTAGYWRVSEIDVVGSVGTNPAVTIDDFGRIHTVYQDTDNANIVYSYGKFEGFIPASSDTLTSPF